MGHKIFLFFKFMFTFVGNYFSNIFLLLFSVKPILLDILSSFTKLNFSLKKFYSDFNKDLRLINFRTVSYDQQLSTDST